MRILNLYAGIGGNRRLWGDEHDITAVEYKKDIADVYSEFYPNDTIVVADAHQYLLDHYKEFDFIWSSPPCPTHSRVRTSLIDKSPPVYPDMALYQEIIFLKHFFKGSWVVENVITYYGPLIPPTAELDRHYFWSSRPIGKFAKRRTFNGAVTDVTKEVLSEYHGIELPPGTKDQRKLLRNAVHPELGLHVFKEVNVKQEVLL